MNASASLRATPIPTGVARVLLIAILAAAFVLGGTGGYLVRGLSFSWPASTANTIATQDTGTRPFVIESPPPYASPAQSAYQDSRRVSD
jgi:hypothetical protein